MREKGLVPLDENKKVGRGNISLRVFLERTPHKSFINLISGNLYPI